MFENFGVRCVAGLLRPLELQVSGVGGVPDKPLEVGAGGRYRSGDDAGIRFDQQGIRHRRLGDSAVPHRLDAVGCRDCHFRAPEHCATRWHRPSNLEVRGGRCAAKE